ncbi:MAG: DUF3391 domain-containing protein, partial [Methylotenera sp.]|nr:DUF3391 domain-containing protein [Methylotenera sp.]
MSDIRREKTPVSQLDIGMYVSELDRPWLGTPFMLEGLLIEDNEQIEKIKGICEFVYIDRTLSVGRYFSAVPKEQVAIKRESAINHSTVSANLSNPSVSNGARSTKANTPSTKFSFFDVLKEIHSSNQTSPLSAANKNTADAIFNMQYTNNNVAGVAKSEVTKNPTLTSQIKTDFSNFISGLSSWGGKQKKLQAVVDKAALRPDLAKNQNTIDGYKITIFDEAPPVEDEIAVIYPVYEKSQLATRQMFEALALDQEI